MRVGLAWVLLGVSVAQAHGPDEAAAPIPPRLVGLGEDRYVDAAFGAEARRWLWEAEELEVFAITCDRGPLGEEEVVGGYPVLRRRVLGRGEERAALLEAVYRGVAEVDRDAPGSLYFGYDPSFALRARCGDQVVEVWCDYSAGLLEVLDSARRERSQAGSEFVEVDVSRSTTSAPAVVFEELLGPDAYADRSFAGRTPREWLESLQGRDAEGEWEDEDEVGVRLLGELVLRSGEFGIAHEAKEVLAALGPAAAPGVEVLCAGVRVEAPEVAWEVLGVLRELEVGAAALPVLRDVLEAPVVPTRAGGAVDLELLFRVLALKSRALGMVGSVGPEGRALWPVVSGVLEGGVPELGEEVDAYTLWEWYAEFTRLALVVVRELGVEEGVVEWVVGVLEGELLRPLPEYDAGDGLVLWGPEDLLAEVQTEALRVLRWLEVDAPELRALVREFEGSEFPELAEAAAAYLEARAQNR